MQKETATNKVYQNYQKITIFEFIIGTVFSSVFEIQITSLFSHKNKRRLDNAFKQRAHNELFKNKPVKLKYILKYYNIYKNKKYPFKLCIWGDINTLPLWKAKNKNFRLELMEKLPFRCFLFDVNWSFRSKVTVENITFQSEITCHISYVFYCFLKLLFLIFFTLKFNISRSN